MRGQQSEGNLPEAQENLLKKQGTGKSTCQYLADAQHLSCVPACRKTGLSR